MSFSLEKERSPVFSHDVSFGSFAIFSFSSAALFLFCAPLKKLSLLFIFAERVANGKYLGFSLGKYLGTHQDLVL